MSRPGASPLPDRDRVRSEYEDLVMALIVERQRPVPRRPVPLPPPQTRGGSRRARGAS